MIASYILTAMLKKSQLDEDQTTDGHRAYYNYASYLAFMYLWKKFNFEKCTLFWQRLSITPYNNVIHVMRINFLR